MNKDNSKKDEKGLDDQTIDLNQNESDQETPSKEYRIYELEVRIQEISSTLENHEDIFYNTGEKTLDDNTVNDLHEEYKRLRQEIKEINRSGKGSIWDNMPIWMALYATFQFIFSFFYILTEMSRFFVKLTLPIFSEPSLALLIILYYFIPFISLVISLIILIIIKNKINKKTFAVIFLIQGIETIVAALIMLKAFI